ncbi:copper resistance D family protein [Nocardia pseudobrasiliensis]|uniref:Putative copper resistance protein D n=1 Tax=Nocardia pseudobrasiliensis TaxID=45979 RepID=A0A370HXE7_9NOCA|nr:CopD family protein [Nocardia pseudobrasiliensis]RDI61634.1 putative copper resistance protein D [Nocardia pseudobrasiliensis]
MTGGSSTALRSVLLLVVPAALLGVALAWALAAPDAVQSEAPVRALADCAGAIVLGLAALPRLHERLTPPWRLLAAFGGLWTALEFAVLACEAAQVVGVRVAGLRAGDFGTYLTRISGGQIGIAILVGTAVVTGYCALAYRRPAHAAAEPVLVFAAVALVLRPITGHMSQQALGSVLGAVHALAAAGWFGMLLALALVLRTRGEWAVVLPRYSGWALPAAATVAATGVCNGLVRMKALTPLFDTGYGRVLLAKTVLMAALLALGWWWRRAWVPRASEHRLSAQSSLRRAIGEVVTMAVVFGLAATLAVTA